MAVVLIMPACKKDDATEQVRLFRPVLKQDLKSEGNWIEAVWQPIKGAVKYKVEISRDEFKTIEASKTIDSNGVIFENLSWNKLYQVQIKAIAADTTYNSRISSLGAIKTAKYPTILETPVISDFTDVAARVRWKTSGETVTSIKVYLWRDSTLVKEVPLDATDVTNQYKIISGLQPNTMYIIYLYSGTALRGWDDYQTKETLTGGIIDLREVSTKTSVLADTLPKISAGSIVLLKRGYTYTISSALSLSKTVTIMSGDDLSSTERANIFMSSNFNIVAGSVIDSIAFKDVYLYSDGYSSKYVFNVNAASTIGKISFESCRAHIFRGMVRLQSAIINVTDFSVNNCVIDSLANYGLINVDNTNCKINNIYIGYSTIYKCERIVVSKQSSNSVIIEKCTINEAPLAGSNALVDYNGVSVALGIRLTGNIIGSVLVNGTNVQSLGIRILSGSVDVASTYNTTDHSVTANAVPNLIAYAGKSTDLWTDPTKGVFTFKDGSFAGKNTAGDPRWK